MQEKSNKHKIKKHKNIETQNLPYLNYGIFFSILVHIFLIYSLIKNPESFENYQKESKEIFYVEIAPKLISNKKIIKSKDETPNYINPKNQIVDNSDIVNNKVPNKTNLKSDKNNAVDKEQIKRGDSLNINKFKGNKLNNNINKNNNNHSSKKSLSLRLGSDVLLKNFGDFQNNKKTNDDVSSNKLYNYKPFSRPQGSGAKFLGSYGSSMYLPNLPDGDMTMLNTKAEYFAVFVRRVATRVFSELRLSGWENLSREDIYQTNSFSEIEATMSLKGDIINVALLSSSGSFSFDDILKRAVKTAGKDSNPPSNAKAADGLIHFIFQAKSWSKMGTNPNGSLGERRWLLLSTGLK